ncbi:MAG: cob(I)yrinic acid a,c-diamide adenosyltransferase [Bythopirellula sp.]|nr:cob(I)yrinic acid a,c-diamide adenosyltransferase [Bythopirellula sp.]
MKIYTCTGDDGSTGLYGGGRVSKCDPRVEAFGAVDELNAQLGVVRAGGLPEQFDSILYALQNRMFDLGAELATPDAAVRGTDYLQATDVAQVETWIDEQEALLPPLQTFILPGGSPSAAQIHLARCVCRRAERQVVALAQVSPVRELVIRYLNRVGDFLFVLARSVNQELSHADVAWQKRTHGN